MVEANKEAPKVEAKEEPKKTPDNQGQRPRGQFGQGSQIDSPYIEKVIQINRIAKVVKGGRRFHFSALVVVGDGEGKMGYALSKGKEVADAIRKAMTVAKRSQKTFKLHKKTVPHEMIGRYGAAKVLLKPASEGTGVIAGGAVRAVCESIGIRDILTKNLGSDNPINVLKATVAGLNGMRFREDEIREDAAYEKAEAAKES